MPIKPEQLWHLDLIIDTSHIEAGTQQEVTILDVPQTQITIIDTVLDTIEVSAPKLIQRNWWQTADDR